MDIGGSEMEIERVGGRVRGSHKHGTHPGGKDSSGFCAAARSGNG